MRNLILAAAVVALIGAPSYAATKKTNTTAPANATAANTTAPVKKAKKTKAPAMAATPAAGAPAPKPATVPAPAKPATAAMAAKPAPSAMAAKPAPMAAKPATPAPAPAAGKGGTMKACATQWDGFSADQKAAYTAQAKGKTGKSGKALSGYNVFTGECMKKK